MTVKPCSGCRKRAYSSYAVADKVRHRSNVRNRGDGDDGSVYWCPTVGGWHVTSWDRGDFDRVAARRYPPTGDNPVDNSGDGGGREIDLTESVDYVGASPATSAPGRVGILPVGPAVGQDPEGQKIGGPSRAWEDRPTPPTRHNLAWEPAVTLPDAARGDAQLDADTPTVPTPVDDARPWDGWDDEYEYAS